MLKILDTLSNITLKISKISIVNVRLTNTYFYSLVVFFFSRKQAKSPSHMLAPFLLLESALSGR